MKNKNFHYIFLAFLLHYCWINNIYTQDFNDGFSGGYDDGLYYQSFDLIKEYLEKNIGDISFHLNFAQKMACEVSSLEEIKEKDDFYRQGKFLFTKKRDRKKIKHFFPSHFNYEIKSQLVEVLSILDTKNFINLMITKRYFGKQVNEIEIYLENTLFRKTLFFTGECAFKKAWLEKFDKNKKVKKVIITDSNGKISKEFENNPSVLPLNQIYNEQSLRSLKLNDETETVKVAILDSGFDYNHPGLAYMIPRSKDNAINGRDFYENDNLPYEEITPKKIEKNSINHGTHVAGIATKGIKDVVIIPIVFNSKFYYESIQFAYDQGARIINMSFGSESAEDYRAIEKAMNDFPDMLFIAGAGNDKTNIDSEGKNFFPAEFKADNLITVAAVNKDNNLARFSNYGMESVDVAAQGVFIKSFFTGGDTGYASGTSMATPQVTNLAIRIKQVNPDLSPVEIKEIIMKTVIKTDELELRVKSGGFIDFENAINYASKI